MTRNLQSLSTEIRACSLCRADMQRPPNPIFQVSERARVLIASQAPGNLADVSGVPFKDPSGVRLRQWLDMDDTTFYDPDKVAIVPMGFCFPGYDRHGGDLPPMKRCAPTWRTQMLSAMPQISLTIVVGGYAQRWHLGPRAEKSLTATVAKWRSFLDDGYIVTPHPSWRNNAWLKRNPWFEDELLPHLQERVRALL